MLASEPALGLTTTEATARRTRDGPNDLQRSGGVSGWRIFARQFAGVMSLILAIAGAIALAVGETGDAIAIAAILVINAIVGFVQEHRAERAVLALRAMTAPHARVTRDGHATDVPARDVVTGDLLLLEAGDIIAADAKLVEVARLATGEAALTGESLPVDKRVQDDGPETLLAERPVTVLELAKLLRGGSPRLDVIATPALVKEPSPC